jgi:hypothetical protein
VKNYVTSGKMLNRCRSSIRFAGDNPERDTWFSLERDPADSAHGTDRAPCPGA